MSGLYGVGWPDGSHNLPKKKHLRDHSHRIHFYFEKREKKGVEGGNVMNVVKDVSAAVKHVCLACDHTEKHSESTAVEWKNRSLRLYLKPCYCLMKPNHRPFDIKPAGLH